MQTERFEIADITRRHSVVVVEPEDFALGAHRSVDAESVYKDPRYTLYCFDPANQAALFVECDDPEKVEEVPFYYQGQVEQATAVVRMPLQIFHRLADESPGGSNQPILIHSVGRCGSTLLSKVLATVPSVRSLSEPDDLTQLVRLRTQGVLEDQEIVALLKSSLRWRAKDAPMRRLALKTRSEVLVLWDLIGATLPNAKHFFLYRDGLSWMRTIFRGAPADDVLKDPAVNRNMEDNWAKMLPIIQEYRSEEEPMSPIQIRMLAWITCMEGYLGLLAMGIPARAARYEDLTADPDAVIRSFFEFVGIEDYDREVVHDVLSRDSQAGTSFGREERRAQNRQMTPEQEQSVFDLVATRPKLMSPHVRVPNTLYGV